MHTLLNRFAQAESSFRVFGHFQMARKIFIKRVDENTIFRLSKSLFYTLIDT